MINNPWQAYQAPQAYQTQQYQPNTYRPAAPQMMDGAQYMMQPGMINARYVTCREEAVAAQIMDGTPWLFLDRDHGMVYCKGFNSRTGAAEFIEFAIVQPQQPQQPQFAPIADFMQLRNDFDQFKNAVMAPQQPRQKAPKNEEGDAK